MLVKSFKWKSTPSQNIFGQCSVEKLVCPSLEDIHPLFEIDKSRRSGSLICASYFSWVRVQQALFVAGHICAGPSVQAHLLCWELQSPQYMAARRCYNRKDQKGRGADVFLNQTDFVKNFCESYPIKPLRWKIAYYPLLDLLASSINL